MEIIIPLSDTAGNITGYEEKIEVHKKGLLHLAFSVLVFNTRGQLLLQKRADGKYHSPSLWTNTCCGHPNRGEEIGEAAERRLAEEMGFTCTLTHRFTFHYRAAFTNGLFENEIDHVFFGTYEGAISPDPQEISDYRWVDMDDLQSDAEESPEKYTVWFKEILKQLNSLPVITSL